MQELNGDHGDCEFCCECKEAYKPGEVTLMSNQPNPPMTCPNHGLVTCNDVECAGGRFNPHVEKPKYKLKHWWWKFLPPRGMRLDMNVYLLSSSNLLNEKVTGELAEEFLEKYYVKR